MKVTQTKATIHTMNTTQPKYRRKASDLSLDLFALIERGWSIEYKKLDDAPPVRVLSNQHRGSTAFAEFKGGLESVIDLASAHQAKVDAEALSLKLYELVNDGWVFQKSQDGSGRFSSYNIARKEITHKGTLAQCIDAIIAIKEEKENSDDGSY